jgi:hypothetical protein
MSPRFFTNFFHHPDKTFGLFSIVALLMLLLSSGIPFFWDNIALSEVANYYYDTSFRHLIPPAGSDFGAFTLEAFYLSAVWSLLGHTLPVSHMAMAPFVVGILWEVRKISLRVVRPGYLPLIYLLLLADPAFGTQTLLMGYDVFMLYFVLLSVRLLWEKKPLWYALSLLLLSAVSVRGIIFVVCLFLAQGFITLFIDKTKLRFREMWVYLPALVFVLVWSVFHYLSTGWWLMNPVNASHRSANGFTMVMRQLGYVIWKLMDSGRIALWIFCGWGLWLFAKRRVWTAELKKFLLFLALPLLLQTGLMIFISNPIGHKYFLQTFLFLSIMAIVLLQEFSSAGKRLLLTLSLLLMLLAGNFIMYPQKYGNAWDTSLKVLPFFRAERQMKDFVVANHIPPAEVFTAFPLTANRRFSYLTEDFAYSELQPGKLDSCHYLLCSNLLNVADLSPWREAETQWTLLYRVQIGQVYLGLYRRPVEN